MGGRVDGRLALSRALGDFSMKDGAVRQVEQKVSPEPEIVIVPRSPSDELLVVACDGIWDVVDNEQCCMCCWEMLDSGEADMGLIAEELLEHCLELGSQDNMTAVCVALPGARVGEGEGTALRRRKREAAREAEAASAAAEASTTTVCEAAGGGLDEQRAGVESTATLAESTAALAKLAGSVCCPAGRAAAEKASKSSTSRKYPRPPSSSPEELKCVSAHTSYSNTYLTVIQ